MSRGKLESTLTGHAGAILSLALDSAGRLLASGGDEGQVRIWDVWSGKLLYILPKQIAKITGLAWFPQKQTLAVACGERLQQEWPGDLHLWNFAALQLLGIEVEPPKQAPALRLERNGIWSLAIADGPMVAYGGGARGVVAWDLKRQESTEFRQSTNCLAVALGRDGHHLAASAGRTIKLFDVERGREIAAMEGHKGMIRALAFSPDGQTLASGSADNTIRFWPVTGARPGQPNRIFEWPIGGVFSVAFSPDGVIAAAGGDKCTIVVWDVDM